MATGAVCAALLVSTGRASTGAAASPPATSVSPTPPAPTAPRPPRPTTTTTVAVTSTVPPRKLAPTTTIRVATTVATEPEQTRETCLDLALLHHLQVVTANQAWYQQQLQTLSARHLVPSPQFRALQIQQAQTQDEIEAQYAIDRSNCYLG
jgi:hypothetical protein